MAPPLHGTRVAPREAGVGGGARWAEGLGIRAVARVFEVDPNTVLQWLSRWRGGRPRALFPGISCTTCASRQVQLDELFALLSAVQANEVSEPEAITPAVTLPQLGLVALDPVRKLLLTIDVGDRTRRWRRVWSIRWPRCWHGLCAVVSHRRAQGVCDGPLTHSGLGAA